MNPPLRQLPPVQAVLETAAARWLVDRFSRAEVVDAIRAALGEARTALRADPDWPPLDCSGEVFFADLAARILAARRPKLRPVINGTGVVIHTNLGRAPLAPEALAAITRAAQGPANLEFDLDTGKRGSRQAHVQDLICTLTGAEAAIVVNNCAAAVLVALSALAAGGEVIVSRGELIEIGGAFRMPDVIAQSGAVLCEVGTTNKTTLTDYERAIGSQSRVLLKSHTSNFRIVGFTAAPARKALAGLARDRDLVLMEDLGSGVLVDLAPYGLADEPIVADILRSGVDIVTFSGDKLLGGPQAGIIAGRRAVMDRLKGHPLLRAMRIDKLSLAALEATLRLYLPPHDPFKVIPVLRMLADDALSLRDRAARLVRMIGGAAGRPALRAETVASRAFAGGGSLPQQDLPSHAVALDRPGWTPDALAAALRAGDPPVIGRIADGRVMIDMRAVREDDLPAIAGALAQVTA
ncbi:MAG: L-seryl-tRNA(Sec) selenium transferase [Alphaproteobacteria bacterium]